MPETEARPSPLKHVIARIAALQAFVILSVVYYAGLGAASLFSNKRRGEDPKTGWTQRPELAPAEHLASQG